MATSPLRTNSEARVTITVKGFTPVLKTAARKRGCEHTIKLAPHPRVTVKRGYPEVLQVHGNRQVKFRFIIENGTDDPKQDFKPVGIAFVRRTSPAKGKSNFRPEDVRIFDHSLTIKDRFKNCGTGQHYYFSIIIQDRLGTLGIVDPGIENDY